MAKKKVDSKKTEQDYKKILPALDMQGQNQMNAGMPEDLPKEAKAKLDSIKKKVNDFEKKILKKYDSVVMGISLLPPQKDENGKVHPEIINALVLIDDTDNKLGKLNIREPMQDIVSKLAKEADKNLDVKTLMLNELWQNCYDGKHDYLQLIASGAQVYDKGMLAAIKISEIHKTMVLKKFEKYIVSYVLAGSLVQGKATPESDIDVFMVIDDTDVKKMTRAELKDKLRAIIIGMGLEAAEMTGIKNKLNIQVYILTDFWENIKEANPIIFTFLRDGIPFYDRGIFMPWKQLLRMGKIKPSPEAIDMMMSSGEQMISRVKMRIKEIGMEDIFYALLMPTQAAIMLYGVAPPTPKETPGLLEDIFVKKEKMLDKKYVKILKDVIQVRKDLEHGSKENFSGTELDRLLNGAQDYLERINNLFTEIDLKKESQSIIETYDEIMGMIRDILIMDGESKVLDKDIPKLFEDIIISKGYLQKKYSRSLSKIIKAKSDYKNNKLNKVEIKAVQKEARSLIKELVEFVQRKRGASLEKTKIRVKHGDKYGEVILLGTEAYIIHDIDNPEKGLSKADIKKDGSLKSIKKGSMADLEKALSKLSLPPKVFIKQPIFDDLKEIFGKDVEVMINY